MTRRRIRVRLRIEVRELELEDLAERAQEAARAALRDGGGTRTGAKGKAHKTAPERARRK